MHNIIVYIGTRKGHLSNTYRFIKEVLDTCENKNKNISTEIITADEITLKHCIGCEHCFITGKCQLDQSDDGLELKKKLLKADMIILASPVYAHNVSGDMKIFIDRISYWLHNMKLNRKHAAIVSTTLSNGHLTVVNYLEKILCFLGANIVFKINVTISDNDEFQNEHWMSRKKEELSNKIIKALNEPICSNTILEMVFKSMQEKYIEMKNADKVIGNFREIEEQGLFFNDTYQEFLDQNYNNMR